MRQHKESLVRKIGVPIGYIIIFIGLAGIIMVFTFSKPEKAIPKEIVKNTNTMITGVTLPEKVDFAGEPVPVDYFDVREGLEREMLINSYWQSQTLMLLKRSTRYFVQIEPILKRNNIPDDFKYLALAESGFVNVTSPAGAVGFWQFMSDAAKDYGLENNKEVDERYNLEKSTEAACKFFRDSYKVYKTWTMAAASYNMGRCALNAQIERQHTKDYYDILLNEETARYVYRSVAIKLILMDPQKYGFDLSKEDYYQPIPCSDIKVNQPIGNLALFAIDKGTNYKMLKLLNPWLRENYLTNPAGKTYYIKIPSAGYRKVDKELKKEEVDKIMSQSEQLVQ